MLICTDVFDRLYSVINTGCLNRGQEGSMEMSPNTEKDLEELHVRYRPELHLMPSFTHAPYSNRVLITLAHV